MKRYTPLIIVSLFVFVMASVAVSKHSQNANAQTGSFTFGAAGDFSSTTNTDKVLTAFKNGGLSFALGLGDLSYDTQGSPSGWGSYVKNIIGTTPFAFVMGNHDASKVGQFVSALPNPMSNAQGDYGKQYYFDYPATSPLARFIMISPVDGNKDITWFNSTVDSARSSGIKWIFVGMHQPCVSTGQKSCEIGQDMMDAMTAKKVDVILFGHDHNYQRSKQLTCAKSGSFNASCVAANGPTFTKGAGSVLVVVGTGGNSFYGTNQGDSEAGYFAALQGNTYGFAKFTVSATQIQETFVAAGGGSFSDSFTISDSTTPTSGATTQPTEVVPTFQCVGGSAQPPCATIPPSGTTLPSSSPTDGTVPSNAPSGGVNPTSGSTQPSPTVEPCSGTNSDSVSTLRKHHKKHRGGGNGGGGFIEQFIQFLMKLLEQLFKQFGIDFPGLPGDPGGGGGGGGTPCPSPTDAQPSVAPTSADQPTNAPSEQPSNAPSTATSPTTGASAAPTTGGGGGTPGDPTATTCGGSANTPSAPVTGYKVTGCEDFNGTSMPSTYSPYDGGGGDTVVGGGRKASQCTVGGGMLTLTQLADGSTCGGSMSFSQKYGYWEVRMKAYSTGGSGSAPHPVLILWPSTDVWNDGELDYFEGDIGESGAEVFLHCVGNASSNCYNTKIDTDIAQWHTYGFEWTAAGFVGYLDGKQIYTTDGKGSNPSVAMQQTIQLDNLSGNTPAAPGKMDVDWVHMYSK